MKISALMSGIPLRVLDFGREEYFDQTGLAERGHSVGAVGSVGSSRMQSVDQPSAIPWVRGQ